MEVYERLPPPRAHRLSVSHSAPGPRDQGSSVRVDWLIVGAGRLADYLHDNMDQAVGGALTVFEREVAG